MRLIPRRHRLNRLNRLVATAAAVAAWAAFTPGTAVATSAHEAGSQCKVMDNLVEKTVRFKIHLGAPEQVGLIVTYWDEIYAPDGTTIGTVTGHIVLVERRPADGHLMQINYEEINLSGGTFVAFAYLDRTAMRGGSWATLPMVGTGGDYIGAAGNRTVQLLSIPDATVRLIMTICPR